jgi:hypothetical protein
MPAVLRAQQRHRLVGGVRDQPDVVHQVQLARLRRHVGGREAVAQVRVVARVDALGQHLAVAFLAEAVDQVRPKPVRRFISRPPVAPAPRPSRPLQLRQEVARQRIDRGLRAAGPAMPVRTRAAPGRRCDAPARRARRAGVDAPSAGGPSPATAAQPADQQAGACARPRRPGQLALQATSAPSGRARPSGRAAGSRPAPGSARVHRGRVTQRRGQLGDEVLPLRGQAFGRIDRLEIAHRMRRQARAQALVHGRAAELRALEHIGQAPGESGVARAVRQAMGVEWRKARCSRRRAGVFQVEHERGQPPLGAARHAVQARVTGAGQRLPHRLQPRPQRAQVCGVVGQRSILAGDRQLAV